MDLKERNRKISSSISNVELLEASSLGEGLKNDEEFPDRMEILRDYQPLYHHPLPFSEHVFNLTSF